ncbi:MAG TPA: thymidylate synthase [Candidatus Paceibacterota bacterium]|jgi:thymidylate synthase|nr:thymidylate synthase [Candidatus Paceibacterota bacterium]
MTKFDAIYQKALRDIMTEGIEEVSIRQGVKTKAIPGLTFSIDIERDGFPVLTLRKIPIRVFVAEQVWFLSGSRKPEEFLRDYTKIWDDFTNPNDVVTVAYGYRWRKHFGRDQIALLIDLLQKEPSSRHGVIVTWDPANDGLSLVKKKNVPCPFTFTVGIVGGRLHLHNIVRSNDMILGCPHDVAGFALLQCILAQKLGVKPGIYTHSISNAHIYDSHYDAAKEIVGRTNEHASIELHLPADSFDRAENKDRGLADEIIDDITKQYQPSPAIPGIKIVL